MRPRSPKPRWYDVVAPRLPLELPQPRASGSSTPWSQWRVPPAFKYIHTSTSSATNRSNVFQSSQRDGGPTWTVSFLRKEARETSQPETLSLGVSGPETLRAERSRGFFSSQEGHSLERLQVSRSESLLSSASGPRTCGPGAGRERSFGVELGSGAWEWSLGEEDGSGGWEWRMGVELWRGGWERRLGVEVGSGPGVGREGG